MFKAQISVGALNELHEINNTKYIIINKKGGIYKQPPFIKTYNEAHEQAIRHKGNVAASCFNDAIDKNNA